MLAFCALICPTLAYGQGGVPASPIQFTGPTGRPLAGATITVCTSAGTGFPCSPLASIFTDAGLSIPASNPVTTDGNGNIPVIFAAPGVYKLSVTGSGITSTLVTATVAGTGGGNVVLGANTGSISFTGTESDAGGNHTGPETFTGLNTATCFDQLNGVLYVGGACAAAWGSGDIGSQVNAAYLVGASTGVHVHVIPGVYNFTTPILAATGSKPLFLECAPGVVNNQTSNASTTQLNYTPLTGTALTLNTSAGSRVTGCSLSGAGGSNSTIGVVLGGTNGCIYCGLNRMDIGGFGVGLQFGNSVYITEISQNSIHDNGVNGTRNVYFPSGLSGTGENIFFTGGSISNKGSGFSTSCFDIENGGMHLGIINVSLDQCGMTINAVNLVIDVNGGTHMENPNGATTADFVTIGAAANAVELNWTGGWINEDIASGGGRTELVSVASAVGSAIISVNFSGGKFVPAQTTNAFINSTTACCVGLTLTGSQFGNGGSGFSNIAAGTYSAKSTLNSASGGAGDFSVTGLLQAGTNLFLGGRIQNVETTIPSGVGGSNVQWADSTDHFLKYIPNNQGEQHVPQAVLVSSVYTNATTTPSNIAGLAFTVAANRNYTMVCQLYYQGSASTAGLDVTITGPATPTSVIYSYQETVTATTTQGGVATAFGTKIVGNATVTATTNLPVEITMGLRNGANAGTVQVQGSATGVGTVTVQPGSYCTMQ